MKIPSNFLEKLDILKSNIGNKESKSVSNILLFKDYLRTMYEWYNELGVEWNYNITKRKEGHNLINIISSKLMENSLDLDYFRLNMLNDTNFGLSEYRSLDYYIIYLYIYWELLKGSRELSKFNKPNPYTPALKILLRGGHINYVDKNYNVSGIDIRKDNKTFEFKMPSIEDEFLDYIDAKCKLIGSDGIPNQNIVNKLWKEFSK